MFLKKMKEEFYKLKYDVRELKYSEKKFIEIYTQLSERITTLERKESFREETGKNNPWGKTKRGG